MGIVHRVWGYVSDEEFYKMLQRARSENCYVDERGMVDIGKLIHKLVETYGDGTYCILPVKHNGDDHKRICNDTDAHYVAASAVKVSVETEAPTQSTPTQENTDVNKKSENTKKRAKAK